MRSALELAYLGAAVLFVVGLKWLSSPRTARRGNGISAVGMLLVIVVTLAREEILSMRWIAVGLAVGTAVGVVWARRVAMTAMPETVALLNGFGGLASLGVACAEHLRMPEAGRFESVSVLVSVLIGGVTFSGSVLAWAKLAAWLPGRPLQFAGQQVVNGFLLLGAIGLGVAFETWDPAREGILAAVVVLSLLLGVLLVLPIGGADMPVVISLLNSFSGMAAAATGFVLLNSALIVTGALVGASGLILTRIMCAAMNRSLANVLFSGFGSRVQQGPAGEKGSVREISVADAFALLEAARSVVMVPGYGLAVAQAQHALRELGDLLAANGAEVIYAIHPVAGRMPGHLNVLLSEAGVPYEQLIELEPANARMATVDVCLVVGANDVVNPAAREDPKSPIYGMPIIDADRARTVLILKRSLAPGFAGIENRLFTRSQARMLFGDAKTSLQSLAAEFDPILVRQKTGFGQA